jgi:hypothetical protein
MDTLSGGEHHETIRKIIALWHEDIQDSIEWTMFGIAHYFYLINTVLCEMDKGCLNHKVDEMDKWVGMEELNNQLKRKGSLSARDVINSATKTYKKLRTMSEGERKLFDADYAYRQAAVFFSQRYASVVKREFSKILTKSAKLEQDPDFEEAMDELAKVDGKVKLVRELKEIRRARIYDREGEENELLSVRLIESDTNPRFNETVRILVEAYEFESRLNGNLRYPQKISAYKGVGNYCERCGCEHMSNLHLFSVDGKPIVERFDMHLFQRCKELDEARKREQISFKNYNEPYKA